MNPELPALVNSFIVLRPLQALAALVFDLNTPAQSGNAGGTLIFNATLINIGPGTIYLNGDVFDAPRHGLIVDDTNYLAKFPVTIPAGHTFTGELFSVSIDPDVPGGVYTGAFTLIGGTNHCAQDNLATDYFDVTVIAAPQSSPPNHGSFNLLVCSGPSAGTSLITRRIRKTHPER